MSVGRGVRFAVVSLLTCVAMVGVAPSANASLDTVRGGQTGLFTPLSSVSHLAQDRIYVSPIAPAFLTFNSLAEGPAIRFPISNGAVESDSMLGTVNHAGGMLIQKFNPDDTIAAQLESTNPRIVNGNTLVMDTNGLIPAPTADLVTESHSKDPATGVIHYEADATVPAATATVLNTYFSTTVFEAGMLLGRIKSNINTLGPVRPRAASPVNVSLVPAYTPCASPDRVHGPPLEHPSCSSPAGRSAELTVGTPDSNGRLANSVGNVAMKVVVGDPLTTADEADVRLSVDITDVRRKSDLSDYTGELEARTTVRLTDRLNANANGLTESTTLTDFPFAFVVPCTATDDADTGSECAVSTTADAVSPGLIDEGARAVWQLGQVTVTDGGADGVAATGPNGVFAVQGIFVP